MINETVQWKRLEEHANQMKAQHLRKLLQDRERSSALTAEHNDIVLDYSREIVTAETMVLSKSLYYYVFIDNHCLTWLQDLLFDLASVAGVDQKRENMVSGQHINSTENRAG